jgi:hypothetical protein
MGSTQVNSGPGSAPSKLGRSNRFRRADCLTFQVFFCQMWPNTVIEFMYVVGLDSVF